MFLERTRSISTSFNAVGFHNVVGYFQYPVKNVMINCSLVKPYKLPTVYKYFVRILNNSRLEYIPTS